MHLAPEAQQPSHFKMFCSKRRFHFICRTSPNASNPLTQRCQSLKTEGQNFSEMTASTYGKTQPAHLPEVDIRRVESQVRDCQAAPWPSASFASFWNTGLCEPLCSVWLPFFQCILKKQRRENDLEMLKRNPPLSPLPKSSSHVAKLDTSFASCEMATGTADSPGPSPPNSPKFNCCILVYWLPCELMFLHKTFAISPHPKADRT